MDFPVQGSDWQAKQMEFYVLGINFKNTPLELREKFSFSSHGKEQLCRRLLENPLLREVVVVCTCNRTEIYAYSKDSKDMQDCMEQYLCVTANASLLEMKKYFYFYCGKSAVDHLFKVTSGLDSMLIGEDQILKQIRDSLEDAKQAGFCGNMMDTLFRYSITSAKKVKTTTRISKHASSLSSVAIREISETFGDALLDKTALVIGVGKVGQSVVKRLLNLELKRVIVTNRTHEKSKTCANQHPKVSCVNYSDRYASMEEADIIISCTASPHYTITRDMFEKALMTEKKRICIDLAVPRDIDPDVENISSVDCLNVDALGQKLAGHLSERMLACSHADAIIASYTAAFEKWYMARKTPDLFQKINRVTEHLVKQRLHKSRARMNKVIRTTCDNRQMANQANGGTDLRIAENETQAMLKSVIDLTARDFLNTFIYSVRENCPAEDIERFFKILDSAVNTQSV